MFFSNWFNSASKKSGQTLDEIRKAIAENTVFSGSVSAVTSLEVSAVSACVRVIGEGIAQVPLKIMKRDGDNRAPATDHPLYKVLSVKPNEWQTSFEYRETIAMHAVLVGNHYSFINRSEKRGIMELIPFAPGSVEVLRDDEHLTLQYKVTGKNGSSKIFPGESIWHIKGPSWNSWQGLDAVKLARKSILLSSEIESQQIHTQQNGVKTSGIYSVDGVLKDDQYKALKKWISANIEGSSNSGVMLLDRNAKYSQTSMTSVDAQTLETRRYQVEEICRFFRVNPIMVGAESKNTTYASAEQMFLAHVVHTLSPWYKRIEQSIDANLLTDDERAGGLYSRFIDDALLRGSMETRKDVILGYVNGGMMTANEGRALLDLNPDESELSNELRIPANVVGAAATQEDDTDET